MKTYRVYYEDKPGSRDFEVEALDHRAVAQQFFSERPRSEHCRIVAESIDWLDYRDFDASEFMDEAQRARASLPPSPAGQPMNAAAGSRAEAAKGRIVKHALMKDSASKLCPFCKEQIREEAIKCRFCGEWLEPTELDSAPTLTTANSLSARRGSFTQGQETGGGGVMNKYQKILTIAALMIFSAIIVLHCYELPIYRHSFSNGHDLVTGAELFVQGWWGSTTWIPDIHMPLFALGVLYAGSMALAWTRRAQ
jgi:hypothetical protein